MDPVTILGAVGSVVGIAAFGLQLSEFVNDFLGQYERANESLQDVCYGLEVTIAVLDQIEELLHLEKENRTSKPGKPKLFSDKALADVRKNTDGCLKVFWKIEATILSVKETPKELEERIRLKLQNFHETVKKNQEEGKQVREIIRLERRRNLNRVQKFMYSFTTAKQLARYRDQLNYFQQSLSLLFHIVQLGMHLKAPITPVRNFDLLHTRENINLTVVERRHAIEKLDDQDDDFTLHAEPPSYQTYDPVERSHKTKKELHKEKPKKARVPLRRPKIPDPQDYQPLRSPASSTTDTYRGRTEKWGTYINQSGNEYFRTESSSPQSRPERVTQERSSSESAGSPVDHQMKVAQRHMEEKLKRNLKKKAKSKRATDLYLDPQHADENKKYPEMPFSQSPIQMADDELQSMLPQHGSVTNSPVMERHIPEVSMLKTPAAKAPTKYQKPSVTDQFAGAIEDEISDIGEGSGAKNLIAIHHSKPGSPSLELLNTWPHYDSMLPSVARLAKNEADPRLRVETALLDDPIPGREQALLAHPAKLQSPDASNKKVGNEIKSNIPVSTNSTTQLQNDPAPALSFQAQPISPKGKLEILEDQPLPNSGLHIEPEKIENLLGINATTAPEDSAPSLESAIETRLHTDKIPTSPTSEKEVLLSSQLIPGAWIEEDEETFLQQYSESPKSITPMHVEGKEDTDTVDKKTPKNEARKPQHDLTPLDPHKEMAFSAHVDPGEPRTMMDSAKINSQSNISSTRSVPKARLETLPRQERIIELSPVKGISEPKIEIHDTKSLNVDTSKVETPVDQDEIKKSVEIPAGRPRLELASESTGTRVLISDQNDELTPRAEQSPLDLSIPEDEISRQNTKQKGKMGSPDEEPVPESFPISSIPLPTLEVPSVRKMDEVPGIKSREEREASGESGSPVGNKVNGTQKVTRTEVTGVDKSVQPAAQKIYITLSNEESPARQIQWDPGDPSTQFEKKAQVSEDQQPIDVFQFLVPDEGETILDGDHRIPGRARKFKKIQDHSDLEFDLESSTNSPLSGSTKSARVPNIFRGLRRIQGRAFVTRTNMEDIFGPGTFLTAFVIRGKDYHQIPCPGHFSLRQGELENSQSSGPISWKKFAFLTSDEMSTLSQILSGDTNGKYGGSLVHLKWLRKEKLKFWSNENRALVAIIQNRQPDEPLTPGITIERSENDKDIIGSPRTEQLSQPIANSETATINNPQAMDENIETFVIYAAFTIRVLEPHNEYGDQPSVPSTTDREGFAEADILQRITKLKFEGPHVIEKKLKLLKTQQIEIARIINDMNKFECEPGFVWNVAQLEAIQGQSTGLRSVTVYLRKTPIGVEAIIMERTYSPTDQDNSTILMPAKNSHTVEVPREMSPLAPLAPTQQPASIADKPETAPIMTPLAPLETNGTDTGRGQHKLRTERRSRKSSTESAASMIDTWPSPSNSSSTQPPGIQYQHQRSGIYNPRPYIPESSVGNGGAWSATRYESYPNPFKSENRGIYFPDAQAQYTPPSQPRTQPPYQPSYQPSPASYWAPPPPPAPSAPPAAPDIPERRAHFADEEEETRHKRPNSTKPLRHSVGRNENQVDTPKPWATQRPPSARSNAYETRPYTPSTSYQVNSHSPRSYLGRPPLSDIESVRKGSVASMNGPVKRRSHLPYPETFDSRSFRLKPTQSEVLQEDTKLVRGLLLEWVPSGDEDEEVEKEKL